MKHPRSILGLAPLELIWETPDPFLMCVHHVDNYPMGNHAMGPKASLQGHSIGQDFLPVNGDPWRMYHGVAVPGFPQHPHRGFETVTVTRTGFVDHADSLGAAGRYGNGDTQWMTSGCGIQHSEMFPLLNETRRNPLEFFQIWLNLPALSKMAAPHFSMLWDEATPLVRTLDANNNESKIKIIAGEFDDISAPAPPPNSWAANPDNHVAIWAIDMRPGAQLRLPPTIQGINRRIFLYEGDKLLVDDYRIPRQYHVDLVSHTGPRLTSGDQGARILLLQGRPINEPLVQHGPFVVNSEYELQRAFADFQSTQFGGWPWPGNYVVHDRDQGRFARFPNGKEYEP